MKKLTNIMIILILSASLAYADNKENCKTIFEEVYQYSIKDAISDIDFGMCKDMLKQLKACGYYEQMIVKDGGSSEGYELDSLYAVICNKTKPGLGIPAYIEHLIDSKSSASESLSTSFESIFRLHPEMVMDVIQKHDITTQDYLLDRLGWGFLNNNYVEKDETISGKTEVKRYSLDATNYEDIFYKAYPVLKEKYEKYKRNIDYIFENCRSYFKGVEESNKEFERKRRYLRGIF